MHQQDPLAVTALVFVFLFLSFLYWITAELNTLQSYLCGFSFNLLFSKSSL